jgi:thiol-disulfide isomerase/thioredoxin
MPRPSSHCPDFEGASGAVETAFNDRFRGLESILRPAQSSGGDVGCDTCADLLKSDAFSTTTEPLLHRLGFAMAAKILGTLVVLALLGMGAVVLYRRWRRKHPRFVEAPQPEYPELQVVHQVSDKTGAVPPFPIPGSKRINVILYYANWCGHCKEFKPIFAEVAAELMSRSDAPVDYIFAQCEAEVLGQVDEASVAGLGLSGYPTVKAFLPTDKAAPDGRNPSSLVGAVGKETLKAWLLGLEKAVVSDAS